MRIDRYKPTKSSFLSVEKDLSIIMGNLEKCSRLKRLLCNNSKNCLEEETPNVSIADMVEQGFIKIVPKITIDEDLKQYLVINFDNFTSNLTNNEYRNNFLEFAIVCHHDQWNLGNFRLRPYRIGAEIDSMFNNKYLTGIGTLEFVSANQIILTDEFSGIILRYIAIHGEEDKNSYSPIEGDEDYYIGVLEEMAEENEE